MPSRFPPPWRITEEPSCFTVQDANGFSITWFWWNASEVIGTNPDRMTQKQARAMAVNFAKLPDMLSSMSEVTQPLLSRMSPEERAALRKWISEDRPDLSEGDALRELAREQLIGLGLLALPQSNRSKGARRG